MKNRVLCYRKIAVFLLKGSHFTKKGADNSIVWFFFWGGGMDFLFGLGQTTAI